MRLSVILLPSALLLASTAASAKPCKDGDDPNDDCKEYEAYMAPGASAIVFVPPAGKGDPYLGGGVQLALVQWAHDNHDYGPARGSVFFQASFLKSASSEHVLALYEGGMTLAFERDAERRFAIPYFGFTAGGMYQKGFAESGYLYPLVGMHVFWHPNVVVDVSGGYMFPFVAPDDLRGFRAQASVRLHMW
jgi:hypothetical protein